jgi:hypothetical protein
MAMAFSSIEIILGGLSVNVQTEINYPDAIDDLCNRTLTVFKEAITTAKANDIDITVMSLHTDFSDDDE